MSKSATTGESDWEMDLKRTLPLFGHRNWIVVADAAYPAQSKAGIETVVCGAGQTEAVGKVLRAIEACTHVRAKVYVDAELSHVTEKDAPGIGAYRAELEKLLDGAAVKRIPHEEIIYKLDASAAVFNILILKTTLTIPYTSVFFELDCGYWSAEAEARLRASIPA